MTTRQHILGFLIWFASMVLLIGGLLALTIFSTSCSVTFRADGSHVYRFHPEGIPRGILINQK